MTISLKDFSKCCRCCLSTVNALKPIFGACLDDMLMKLTNLKVVPNDSFPQQMCSRCILKLSAAHTFYFTVMNSQKTLKSILKAAEGNGEPSRVDNCDAEELNIPDRGINTLEIVPSVERGKNTLEIVPSVQHCFSDLEIPIKEIHNESSPLTPETNKDVSDNDSYDYQCLQCQETATDQEQLKAHLQTHLVGVKEQSKGNKDTRAHLCYLCGARFRLRTSLLKHLRMHRGARHQCRRCRRTFAEASVLRVHLLSHSADPKPFRCSCGVSFTQKSSLRKHERQHGVRDRLRCEQCGRSFLYKCSLQRHHERVHSTQECPVCNKMYTGKTLLLAHMKQHTTEIQQSYSLQTDTQDNTMTGEINIQAVTVEFLCLICSSKFQTREGLEVHNCVREEMLDSL